MGFEHHALRPEAGSQATVERSAAIARVLEAASAGATTAQLVQVVRALHSDVDEEEAGGFIAQLQQEQVLVPLWLPLTGPDTQADLALHLPEGPVRECFVTSLSTLRSFERGEVSLERVLDQLEALAELTGQPMPRGQLLHVDSNRVAPGLQLQRRYVQSLLPAVEVLRRLGRPPANPLLEQFCKRFQARYDDAVVPLLEALDEETGIGLRLGLANSSEPLLQKLPLVPPERPDTWSDKEGYLLRRLEGVWRSGATTLDLTEADVRALENPQAPPMPGDFALMVELYAESAEAVDAGRGETVLRLVAFAGASGLLGRFATDQPDLEAQLKEFVCAPGDDPLFVELVSDPQSRATNIARRPVLFEPELVFMGIGGTAPERWLTAEDLLVSVVGDRIHLWSKKLGRRVVPRISCAHNFFVDGTPVYRFLGLLQHQEYPGGLSFAWGPLSNAEFLPRVRLGRVVLAPARWRVSKAERAGWGSPADVRATAKRLGWPRWVRFGESDLQTLVDLQNPTAVGLLVDEASRDGDLEVTEAFPVGAAHATTDDGRPLANEFVLPFRAAKKKPAVLSGAKASDLASRRHGPGGRWLYAKLYGGPLTLDGLVLDGSLTKWVALEGVERWFFVRYDDGEPHLRLRLSGAPGVLGAAREALERDTEPLLAKGLLHRMQFDTYVQEVERYGGPGFVEHAERAFHADSQAVLRLLADGGGPLPRWQLALLSIGDLACQWVPDVDAAALLFKRLAAQFAAELLVDAGRFQDGLSQRFREHRAELEALLFKDHPLAASARVIFAERTQALRPVIEAWPAEGTAAQREALVDGLIHMTANRVLRADQRAQEAILYDMAARLFRTQAAKARGTP